MVNKLKRKRQTKTITALTNEESYEKNKYIELGLGRIKLKGSFHQN